MTKSPMMNGGDAETIRGACNEVNRRAQTPKLSSKIAGYDGRRRDLPNSAPRLLTPKSIAAALDRLTVLRLVRRRTTVCFRERSGYAPVDWFRPPRPQM